MRHSWLILALLLAPTAAASSHTTIRLDGEISTASWGEARTLAVDRALFDDVEVVAHPDEPLTVRWTGEDRPVITQYWANQTVVRDPFGNPLYRRTPTVESRQVDLRPDQVQLEPTRTHPSIRLALDPGEQPSVFSDLNALAIDGIDATQSFGSSSVGMDAQALEFAFESAPDHSGYTTFNGHDVLPGGAYGILLDGWHLTATDGAATFATITGERTRAPVRMPNEAGSPASIETLYLVTISGVNDPMTFEAAWVQFRGFAAAPTVAWSGPSTIHVIDGTLEQDGAAMPVRGQAVDLWGSFEASLRFDGDRDGLTSHVAANGRGVTNIDGPVPQLGVLGQAMLAVPVVDVAAVFVSLFLAAAGFLLVRRIHRPADAGAPVPGPDAAATSDPAPRPDHPRALVERVRSNPMDAEAHLLLGAQLLAESEPGKAVARLDRAFRLDPVCILRFLEEPRFAPARADPNVRQLLARIHQERFRKHWIGYV